MKVINLVLGTNMIFTALNINESLETCSFIDNVRLNCVPG